MQKSDKCFMIGGLSLGVGAVIALGSWMMIGLSYDSYDYFLRRCILKGIFLGALLLCVYGVWQCCRGFRE